LNKRIEFYEWSTGVYREKLRSSELTTQHSSSLRYNVFKDGLEQLIARYSAGESVLRMKESLPRVIGEFYSLCSVGADMLALSSLDDYTLVLWLVSLSILLEADNQEWDRLTAALSFAKRDRIIDRLVAVRDRHSEITTAILFPKPYAGLDLAVKENSLEREQDMKRFLDGYYGQMAQTYWHDTHPPHGKGFFGYWCFELAAIARGYAIPTDKFRDHPLFPRDLLMP